MDLPGSDVPLVSSAKVIRRQDRLEFSVSWSWLDGSRLLFDS